MKWIITRERSDADREREKLTAAGVDAHVVPCIAFGTRAWPRWAEQPGTPVTLITSKRTGTRLIEAGGRDTPRGLIAALAPSTSTFLAQHGVTADITARGGALGLAEAVAQTWRAAGSPAWHFRYPTSDAGLEREEQADAVALLSSIGPVERVAVYETHAAPDLDVALTTQLRAPWSVCFASPSAVDAFLSAAPHDAPPPTHVVCLGRSTAAQWNSRRPSPWREALLTPTVVDTVVSLEEPS